MSFLLYTLFVYVLFTGCSGETTPIDKPVTENDVNHWIEQQMREQYLWCDEIPESGKLEFPLKPEQFFYSLLSKKDGKSKNGVHQYYYSTINEKPASSKAYMGDGNSFGFEYQYYYVENTKRYGLMVLYVLPDSPASEAGLERGDWIYEINDKPVSNENADLNADTSTPRTLKIGISKKVNGAISRTASITSRPVADNPVLVHKTILLADGKKVGYLLYNHFTSGPEGSDDETFNNGLRSAFAQFASDNVNEFVLDLRFNGGGLVSCAQLLATMLAPQSALNDVLCYLTYNDKSRKTLPLDRKRINEGTRGANLNLSRLFVITSKRTASSSEIVINGLAPYMGSGLIRVGDTTEGKNVASIPIASDPYDWELHPIVSYLSNKEDFKDYANGFSPTPGFACDETSLPEYHPLGDPEEYILTHILNYITDGVFAAESKSQSPLRSSTGKTNLLPLYNSLDSKKTNGMAILPAGF
jgi:C-terminal processing protease CtpA/Prc